MQHAALEINDHQFISRAIKQRFRNLIFEGFFASVPDQQYGLVSAR
jgi:hypothetical protein